MNKIFLAVPDSELDHTNTKEQGSTKSNPTQTKERLKAKRKQNLSISDVSNTSIKG